MFRGGKSLVFLAAVVMGCCQMACAGVDDNSLTGVVIGRTGEILHISVPQPVKENTAFEVRPIKSEDPIAEATVLSCTQERPYIALAKVVRGDIEQVVPIGVYAYADIGAVESTQDTYVPKPMSPNRAGDSDRFSFQAGAFRPSTPSLRDTIGEFWQAYRMNYSLVRFNGIDLQLSGEYNRGSSDLVEGNVSVRKTMEIIPMTVLGRIRPIRMGSAHVFLAAGAGTYSIRSTSEAGGSETTTSENKFGHELAAGLESRRGWILEVRYREIPDTEIRGYSLTFGSRF